MSIHACPRRLKTSLWRLTLISAFFRLAVLELRPLGRTDILTDIARTRASPAALSHHVERLLLPSPSSISMPRDKGKSRATSETSSSCSENEQSKPSRHRHRSGREASSARDTGSGQLVLRDSRRERDRASRSRDNEPRHKPSSLDNERTKRQVIEESPREPLSCKRCPG